jgi:septal ring-binding cell division protein DamX
MKKLMLSLAAVVLALGVFAQKTVADVAKFTSETIDLGTIKQGVPTTATFVITNISNEPLLIEAANPTCGCTIGDYTKTPIMPGKTGTITATYNAAAVNHFTKTMTVKFAGIDEVKQISITGTVVAGETAPQTEVAAPAPVVTASPAATKAAAPAKAAKPAKVAKAKKPAVAKSSK